LRKIVLQHNLPEADMGYLFAFADGLVSSWAQLMTSCAAGLSTRFFKVRIPTGPLTVGSATGNFLMNGCLTGKVNTDSPIRESNASIGSMWRHHGR
jgi:hypothetical protein